MLVKHISCIRLSSDAHTFLETQIITRKVTNLCSDVCGPVCILCPILQGWAKSPTLGELEALSVQIE